MKISVVMIDGGFRDNIFAAEYFSKQSFPNDEYEVIWIEYYDKPNRRLVEVPKVKVTALGRHGIYHPSYCFNRGIEEATGEVIVLPDADVVVEEDFLEVVWEEHRANEQLVMYFHRYNEPKERHASQLMTSRLKKVCILTNASNYGGCLTVRKKWLLEINGYEQHPVFASGFHVNGLDVYTRLKNLGLHIKWHSTVKLYHPWHPFTMVNDLSCNLQRQIVDYRAVNLATKAYCGLDPGKDTPMPAELQRRLTVESERLRRKAGSSFEKLVYYGELLFRRLGLR
jgi:glycosyltransferase involved in cell wall biosynthesis